MECLQAAWLPATLQRSDWWLAIKINWHIHFSLSTLPGHGSGDWQTWQAIWKGMQRPWVPSSRPIPLSNNYWIIYSKFYLHVQLALLVVSVKFFNGWNLMSCVLIILLRRYSLLAHNLLTLIASKIWASNLSCFSYSIFSSCFIRSSRFSAAFISFSAALISLWRA